jgi:signal transduction histidine kinase
VYNTKETNLILDKFHLTKAILNVFENAVKYGSSTIVIKTELIKNQFNISIKDDGIGISKSKHSLLFDKFYRVEQGNLHNAKGLGLGLYYVNQMIKREQILKTIWGSDDFFSGRSMDVYIIKIRKYLKYDSRISIESVRNIGLEFKIFK